MSSNAKCIFFKVCVKECPSRTIDFKQMTDANFNEYKQSMVCSEEINIPSMSLTQAKLNIDANKCAGIVLQSKSGNVLLFNTLFIIINNL